MSAMFPDGGQRGFSLVAAIFVLLLLGGLGAAAVNLATTQLASFALDVIGSRMYFTARSALEYGARQAVNSTCAASSNLSIDGQNATLTCTLTSHDELGTTVELYRLVATACSQPSGGVCPNNSPGANYVERQLSMTVARQ